MKKYLSDAGAPLYAVQYLGFGRNNNKVKKVNWNWISYDTEEAKSITMGDN